MSIPAMAWAKRQRTGNTGRKAVLLVLADYATTIEDWAPEEAAGRHYAWPGEVRLADECEMSERSVRTHLACLEEMGYIRRVARPGTGDGRRSDLIILAVDEAGARPFAVDEPVEEGNRQDLPVGATGKSEQGNRQNGAGAPYIEHPSEHPSSIRPEVAELCELLAQRIVENGARTPSITKAWHDACRLLLDRDGLTVEQVRYLIEWSQRHHFWRSNILSMPTLRKQADRLKLQARQEYERANPAASRPRYQTAGERSQERVRTEVEILTLAEDWIEQHGGDPADPDLLRRVAERIKGELANGSATRTPGMYSDIEGEIVPQKEVTAGEGS